MIPFPFQAGQLGRAVSNRGGAEFDYAGFLSGKVGDAWLANGIHYTTTGRTTIANVNDPVGSMTGVAAQFNADQATLGNRPTLREASSKRYFEFDGAGDTALAGTSSSWNFLHQGTGNGYAALAISYAASADPNAIFAALGTYNGSGAATGIFLGFEDRTVVPANNAIRLIIGRGTGSVVAAAIDIISANNVATPQTDLIYEFVKNGSSVELFINNVSRGSGTLSSPSSGNSQSGLYIGQANGNFSLSGRIYGAIVCNSVPDSSTRSAIQLDLASRCVTPPI